MAFIFPTIQMLNHQNYTDQHEHTTYHVIPRPIANQKKKVSHLLIFAISKF